MSKSHLWFLFSATIKYYYFFLRTAIQNRNLDVNLKLRQHKLDLMARFMEIKFINPKLKQKEIAKELGFSSSTLQRKLIRRCKVFINQTNLTDLKKPQAATSKDLK